MQHECHQPAYKRGKLIRNFSSNCFSTKFHEFSHIKKNFKKKISADKIFPNKPLFQERSDLVNYSFASK